MFLLIQGTGFVYETFLRPFIIKHQTDIDKNLQELRSRLWNLGTYYYHNCTELGPTKLFQVIGSLASKHGKIGKSSSEVRIVPASLQSILHIKLVYHTIIAAYCYLHEGLNFCLCFVWANLTIPKLQIAEGWEEQV